MRTVKGRERRPDSFYKESTLTTSFRDTSTSRTVRQGLKATEGSRSCNVRMKYSAIMRSWGVLYPRRALSLCLLLMQRQTLSYRPPCPPHILPSTAFKLHKTERSPPTPKQIRPPRRVVSRPWTCYWPHLLTAMAPVFRDA